MYDNRRVGGNGQIAGVLSFRRFEAYATVWLLVSPKTNVVEKLNELVWRGEVVNPGLTCLLDLIVN